MKVRLSNSIVGLSLACLLTIATAAPASARPNTDLGFGRVREGIHSVLKAIRRLLPIQALEQITDPKPTPPPPPGNP